MTSASKITPVRAPTMRPRPPSREIPPMTAAAKTVKMRPLPWLAVTATSCPAVIRPAIAARRLATMKTPMRMRSTWMPAARAASVLPPMA